MKHRIVMYGTDNRMLEVRARVLATIGCDISVLYTAEQAADALAANPKPALLLICHSSGEKMSQELRSLAQRSGVPSYYIERLMPPQQLISDVCAILEPGDSQAQRSAGCAGK